MLIFSNDFLFITKDYFIVYKKVYILIKTVILSNIYHSSISFIFTWNNLIFKIFIKRTVSKMFFSQEIRDNYPFYIYKDIYFFVTNKIVLSNK